MSTTTPASHNSRAHELERLIAAKIATNQVLGITAEAEQHLLTGLKERVEELLQ
jgi:hypothetical protein